MKKTIQLFAAGLILLSLFSSCSVEKRRYMPGYNVQWKSSKVDIKSKELVQENKQMGRNEILPAELPSSITIDPDETAMASADNSPGAFHVKEKSKYHPVYLAEECDVILLKNGDEIKAKVSEITQNEIKYKKCEDLNGQTYTLRKSEVFMIKYPNGTKEVIHSATSSELKNQTAEKEDSGIFGILSFVSIVLFVLLGIAGFGPGIFILIPAAIVFGAIGIGQKRKLKGFAIAGLILGIAGVILFLIVAATFSASWD
jgi:hypothetical protein